MDGVHPPRCAVCGMAVVCAAAVLPGAVVQLVPHSSHCGAGEYCSACHATVPLPGVWCVVVCGVWAVRVVGYPLSAPPSSWWWVGPSQKSGWCVVVGGMVSEGRQCYWTPR